MVFEKISVLIKKKGNKVITISEAFHVFSNNSFICHFPIKPHQNGVQFEIGVTLLPLINKWFSPNKYIVTYQSSVYSTVYVKFDPKNIKAIIDSRRFTFINTNELYTFGYQCFTINQTELNKLVQDFVHETLDLPIQSVFPFELLQNKYKSPNPSKWKSNPKFSNDELLEFTSKPNYLNDVEAFIEQYHIAGKLKTYMISQAFLIRESLNPGDDIIKSIINEKNKDNYEILIMSMEDSTPENYETTCDELYPDIANIEDKLESKDDSSIHSSIHLEHQEVWDIDDTLEGLLPFGQMVQIQLYGFTYLLYNTKYNDSNIESLLNWLLEENQDQYIGINYTRTDSFYRFIFIVKGKALLITSVSSDKTTKYLPIYQQFLNEHKFIYNNQSIPDFITTVFQIDFNESNFYSYRSLCFECLGIDYVETNYLKTPKKKFRSYTNSYRTPKSIILANAAYNVYDYESFLAALQEHPDLFTIYEDHNSSAHEDIASSNSNKTD